MAFPDGFLWGTATAAHQVEGGNSANDIWFLEHLPRTIFREPSGDAVDHYRLFRDDIALLARLGFTAYRFSVEWARIEPEPGVWDAAATQHYREMLEACHEHGLVPIVTYHHFSSPLWLLAEGGWEAASTVDRFARFCTYVTEQLGDLIGVACTLNEPNLAWLLAEFGIAERDAAARVNQPMWVDAGAALGLAPHEVAPFQFCATEAAYQVKLAAHRAGRDSIKAVRPDLQVGWTLANSDIQSVPGGEDRAASARESVNVRFLLDTRGDDFVGIQTYGRTVFDAAGLAPVPAGASVNTMGEEIYPRAIGSTVREAAEIAQVPVWVTENGLTTDDDTQRLAYFREAVTAVEECLADGIDVRGYVAWSALDNFEWIFGYGPKFGIIAVDRPTQERTVKPSGEWLGRVATSNGSIRP